MITPNRLTKGDKVAIVAPSQAAKKDTVEKAARMLTELELEPVIFDSCYLIDNREEVNAQKRADDINAAFADTSIKGIFAIKAGYGTMEVLSFLDFNMIKNNPKIFVGFSDITGLHLALNKKCNLITYYGPLASSRIYKEKKNKMKFDPYTYDYLIKNLFEENPLGLLQNPEGEPFVCLYKGKGEGEICGGNLTLLVKSLGTEFQIDTKGKLLFMEDMGESIDNIRKMLKALDEYKIFEKCNGILLGTWTKCGEEITDISERETKLQEMFKEVLGKYKKPIIYNIRCGHNVPMLTIPLGSYAILDSENETIILE